MKKVTTITVVIVAVVIIDIVVIAVIVVIVISVIFVIVIKYVKMESEQLECIGAYCGSLKRKDGSGSTVAFGLGEKASQARDTHG